MYKKTIDIYVKQYEAIAKTPYNDGAFSTPAHVPAHLLETVTHIKLSQIGQREFEIHQKGLKFQKAGDAILVPPGEEHLIDEINALKIETAKWHTA